MPAQVEHKYEAAPHGSRAWWVVFVGREPGLYTTMYVFCSPLFISTNVFWYSISEAADRNVRNCPRQQIRHKTSKREAMAYYREMWEMQMVEKWVELEDQ
jgi:hypothetical protein